MVTENQRTALIAISNPITSGRIKTIMKQKGWNSYICSDGDQAVDSYVQNKPHLVFLSLDLSIINGHVAALEIRETDFNARIVFVTSKTRLLKAEDAAYSAGAVGILTTPLTLSKVDYIWNSLFSEIPDAPGVADLDELYPDLPQRDILPQILPPLPLPLPINENLNVVKPKKKRNFLRMIKIGILTISGIIAVITGLIFFEVIQL